MSPPGKEQRRNHEGIGRHHHAAGGNLEGGLVVAARQHWVVEGRAENLLDELLHGASAGAVREIDAALRKIKPARSQTRRTGGDVHCVCSRIRP